MKKIIVIILILMLSINSYASTGEIEMYLDSGFDFLGMKGERLYFQLRDEYANGSIRKAIEFDFKMLRNQGRITAKNLEDNKDIYFVVFTLGAGLKFIGRSVTIKPIY